MVGEIIKEYGNKWLMVTYTIDDGLIDYIIKEYGNVIMTTINW